MEAASTWLLQTLQTPSADALQAAQARHRSRNDDFDLAEVLDFLPYRHHHRLAVLLRAALAPSLRRIRARMAALQHRATDPDDAPHDVDLEEHDQTEQAQDVAAVRAASEIVWFFVRNRKEPPQPSLVDLIIDLHDELLALPQGSSRNQVAKICEWLWLTADARRGRVIAQTMLFLLQKSFGDEMDPGDDRRARSSGTPADVARVYAMRGAIDALELSTDVEESAWIRKLLLRSTTSTVYLRTDSGRKFLAFLLTIPEIRTAVFDALLRELMLAQKKRAEVFGTIFLLAWKRERSEWLSKQLMTIAEKAIYAGSEPCATNLRTLLSVFHSSKRVTGVDGLLNRVYGPILFKNLMVANPRVRKNAVTILADAFPVHDPDAQLPEIEQTIDFQCRKLLELLEDPAPIVRKATVEGIGRILGLLWELIPLASAQKMIDVITTKLAFDASSAHVRVAVFEALEFIARNHLAHQSLAVALPRLGSLIHDNVERVRLAFLDLLRTLKQKRIRVVRYFDVVPLEELLRRLPLESPAAASKIMDLLLSSYFPLEKKGKTAEEIASSQVRACLSMLQTSRDACSFFYKNVYLFIAPGPLCEFSMRLSAIALTTPDIVTGPAPEGKQKTSRKQKGVRKQEGTPGDENKPPRNSDASNQKGVKQTQKNVNNPDRASLLSVVADVLASISLSLEKVTNKQLREYIDGIFGGDALKPFLLEGENTIDCRVASWRLASCVSLPRAKALKVLWRQQLDSVLDWTRSTDAERTSYELLLAALLTCGIRWNLLSPISAVIASWADAAKTGHRTAYLGSKVPKRARGGNGKRSSKSEHVAQDTKGKALFALRACAANVIDNAEVREALFDSQVLARSSSSLDTAEGAVDVVRRIQSGCIACTESVLEEHNINSALASEGISSSIMLDGLAMAWKVTMTCAGDPRSRGSLRGELRELVEWATNPVLLENAGAFEQSFALALTGLNLTHIADCAALGWLEQSELILLGGMAKNIMSQVNMSDREKLVRPVAELLRISYHLLQQAEYDLSDVEDEKLSFRNALVNASKSLLSTSISILRACRIREDTTGRSVTLSVLDEFMADVLIGICEVREKCFEEVLGEPLRQSFENANEAEHDLFAFTVCNVLRSLATKPRAHRRSTADKVLNLLLASIQAEGNYATSSRAAANFVCFLVNSISEFYDVEQKSPDHDSRYFLAALEHAFQQKISPLSVTDSGTVVDEAFQESVSDIQEVLGQLQKLCLSEQPPEGLRRKAQSELAAVTNEHE